MEICILLTVNQSLCCCCCQTSNSSASLKRNLQNKTEDDEHEHQQSYNAGIYLDQHHQAVSREVIKSLTEPKKINYTNLDTDILGVSFAHYSKSQIFSKNSILKKKKKHFHEFFTQLFLKIFLVKLKLSTCQQLKSPKPQHFHKFFTQKNRQFSWEIKVEFLDKKI